MLHDWTFGQKVADAAIVSCADYVGPKDDYVGLHSTTYRYAPLGSAAQFLVEIAGNRNTTSARLVHVPGLTESISHSFVRDRGRTLAKMSSLQRVITLGHNAIGIPHAEDTQTRLEVATARLDILRKTAEPGEKQILLGCSMGSIVVSDIVHLNQQSEKPLDIGGLVFFAPAIRTIQGLSWGLKAQFAAQIGRDGFRELFSRPSLELVKGSGQLATWVLESFRDRKHVLHQLSEIVSTSEFEVLDVATATVPTLIVYGEKDRIVDQEVWKELETQHPATVRTIVIPRKGHEVMDHPTHAGKKLAKEIASFEPLHNILATAA